MTFLSHIYEQTVRCMARNVQFCLDWDGHFHSGNRHWCADLNGVCRTLTPHYQRETMQIGLVQSVTKPAFVNCRLRARRLQQTRENSTLASLSPAEYKQACNFTGPLRVPTAEPDNTLTSIQLVVVRGKWIGFCINLIYTGYISPLV